MKTKFFEVNNQNPQQRTLKQIAEQIEDNAIVAIASDSGYSLVGLTGKTEVAKKLKECKGADEDHRLSVVCSNISQVGKYSILPNQHFKLIKRLVPGPFTFVLEAAKEISEFLSDRKRKTIGFRLPAPSPLLTLLQILDKPLLASSLPRSADSSLYESIDSLPGIVDLAVDSGENTAEESTIVDLTEEQPVIVRAAAQVEKVRQFI